MESVRMQTLRRMASTPRKRVSNDYLLENRRTSLRPLALPAVPRTPRTPLFSGKRGNNLIVTPKYNDLSGTPLFGTRTPRIATPRNSTPLVRNAPAWNTTPRWRNANTRNAATGTPRWRNANTRNAATGTPRRRNANTRNAATETPQGGFANTNNNYREGGKTDGRKRQADGNSERAAIPRDDGSKSRIAGKAWALFGEYFDKQRDVLTRFVQSCESRSIPGFPLSHTVDVNLIALLGKKRAYSVLRSASRVDSFEEKRKEMIRLAKTLDSLHAERNISNKSRSQPQKYALDKRIGAVKTSLMAAQARAFSFFTGEAEVRKVDSMLHAFALQYENSLTKAFKSGLAARKASVTNPWTLGKKWAVQIANALVLSKRVRVDVARAIFGEGSVTTEGDAIADSLRKTARNALSKQSNAVRQTRNMIPRLAPDNVSKADGKNGNVLVEELRETIERVEKEKKKVEEGFREAIAKQEQERKGMEARLSEASDGEKARIEKMLKDKDDLIKRLKDDLEESGKRLDQLGQDIERMMSGLDAAKHNSAKLAQTKQLLAESNAKLKSVSNRRAAILAADAVSRMQVRRGRTAEVLKKWKKSTNIAILTKDKDRLTKNLNNATAAASKTENEKKTLENEKKKLENEKKTLENEKKKSENAKNNATKQIEEERNRTKQLLAESNAKLKSMSNRRAAILAADAVTRMQARRGRTAEVLKRWKKSTNITILTKQKNQLTKNLDNATAAVTKTENEKKKLENEKKKSENAKNNATKRIEEERNRTKQLLAESNAKLKSMSNRRAAILAADAVSRMQVRRGRTAEVLKRWKKSTNITTLTKQKNQLTETLRSAEAAVTKTENEKKKLENEKKSLENEKKKSENAKNNATKRIEEERNRTKQLLAESNAKLKSMSNRRAAILAADAVSRMQVRRGRTAEVLKRWKKSTNITTLTKQKNKLTETLRSAEANRNKYFSNLGSAKVETNRLSAELADARNEIDALKNAKKRIEQELEDAKNAADKVTKEMGKTKNSAQQNKDNLQGKLQIAENEIKRLEDEKLEVEGKLKEAEGREKQLKNEKDAVNSNLQQSKNLHGEKNRQIGNLTKKLENAVAGAGKNKNQLSANLAAAVKREKELTAQLDTATRERNNLETEKKLVDAKLTAAEKEARQLTQNLQNSTTNKDGLRNKLRVSEETIQQLENDKRKIDENLNDAKERERNLKQEKNAVNRRLKISETLHGEKNKEIKRLTNAVAARAGTNRKAWQQSITLAAYRVTNGKPETLNSNISNRLRLFMGSSGNLNNTQNAETLLSDLLKLAKAQEVKPIKMNAKYQADLRNEFSKWTSHVNALYNTGLKVYGISEKDTRKKSDIENAFGAYRSSFGIDDSVWETFFRMTMRKLKSTILMIKDAGNAANIFARKGVDMQETVNDIKETVEKARIFVTIYEEVSGAVRVYIRVNLPSGEVCENIKNRLVYARHKEQGKLIVLDPDLLKLLNPGVNNSKKPKKSEFMFYDVFDTTCMSVPGSKGCRTVMPKEPKTDAVCGTAENASTGACHASTNNDCVFGDYYPDSNRGFGSVVDQVRRGCSVVIFGYGYSGSGKTYTLGTSGNASKNPGVLQLSVLRFLDDTDGLKSVNIVKVFELYGKSNPLKGCGVGGTIPNTKQIQLSQTIFHVPKMSKNKNEQQSAIPLWTEEKPTSKENALQIVDALMDSIQKQRILHRRILPTPNNPESSRSHLFITLGCTWSVAGKVETGYLTIVDMGGSEDPVELASMFMNIKPELVAQMFYSGWLKTGQHIKTEQLNSMQSVNHRTSGKGKIDSEVTFDNVLLRTKENQFRGMISADRLNSIFSAVKHGGNPGQRVFDERALRNYVRDLVYEGAFINETIAHLKVFFVNESEMSEEEKVGNFPVFMGTTYDKDKSVMHYKDVLAEGNVADIVDGIKNNVPWLSKLVHAKDPPYPQSAACENVCPTGGKVKATMIYAPHGSMALDFGYFKDIKREKQANEIYYYPGVLMYPILKYFGSLGEKGRRAKFCMACLINPKPTDKFRIAARNVIKFASSISSVAEGDVVNTIREPAFLKNITG